MFSWQASDKPNLFFYNGCKDEHTYFLKINKDSIYVYEITNNIEIKKIISIRSERDIMDILKETPDNQHEYICRKEGFKAVFKCSCNKDRCKCKSIRQCMLLDIIYDIYYNASLRSVLPSWFLNSALIKSIMLKGVYLLHRQNDIESVRKESIYNWLKHCMDNTFIDINIKGFLDGFPEHELLHALKECKDNTDYINAHKKDLFNFFLRRYNMLDAISIITSNKILTFLIICLLIAPLIVFSFLLLLIICDTKYNSNSLFLSNLGLTIIPFVAGVITLKLLAKDINIYNLLMPRLFFGSFIGWIAVYNIKDIKGSPEYICNLLFGLVLMSCNKNICASFSYIIAIVIVIFLLYQYISFEMQHFFKHHGDYSNRDLKVKKIIPIILYSISVSLLLFPIFSNFYKIDKPIQIAFLSCLVSYVAVIVQIMWEDKPITESG